MGDVTLRELAQELGKDRSSLRKFIIKNGFEFVRLNRAPGSRGQPALALALGDADKIRALHAGEISVAGASNGGLDFKGVFYAVQVIPEFVPHRIKLGFTADMNSRLASHRTAAPSATVLKTWPCRRHWEATAIDSIARVGSALILNEVYEFESVDEMLARADQFFALMPEI